MEEAESFLLFRDLLSAVPGTWMGLQTQGGIGICRRVFDPTDDYLRVVRAELALEAMPAEAEA
jgi:hypothetical protein